jgi:hypothetical protein
VEAHMAAYPNHRVWLFSHYFDVERESEEFRRLIRENDRIIGLFAGHSHKCSVINMGEDYGNKTVAQTGNFSYSFYTAFPTGDINDVYRSFWGFRELTITSDWAQSNYIRVDSDIAVIDGKRCALERDLFHTVEYFY